MDELQLQPWQRETLNTIEAWHRCHPDEECWLLINPTWRMLGIASIRRLRQQLGTLLERWR